MNSLWKTYNFDTSNFDRFFVGADQLAKTLKKNADWLANTTVNGTFPPFNLKKIDENKYVIEMAVAGFARQDIELTLEENRLVIKGETKSDESEDTTYLHRGIAGRNFTRTFTLADNVVIDNAELINGMLKVWMEHIIPEAKKPKKIDIKESATSNIDEAFSKEKSDALSKKDK